MTFESTGASVGNAGGVASSWIAEMLLTSQRLAGFVCPLCCRITTDTCALCGEYLCTEHDVACRVADDAVCESCWRTNR